jgi:hypothetical protein
MRVPTSPPAARGVSQLMYVGDAEVTSSLSTPVKIAIALAIGWLLFGRR